MMMEKPIRLKGESVQLETMEVTHREELYAAANDPTIWTYSATKALGDQFASWFQKAINEYNKKTQIPFVVRELSTHKIIGSTRFYDIYPEHLRLAIGYTWYIPEKWGTSVNPTCKYLLLEYAFEKLKMNRVEFITDKRNARSQAAIKKLGAIQEGTLRQHMVLADGTSRDSVIFSIIHEEWPGIKAKLASRIK